MRRAVRRRREAVPRTLMARRRRRDLPEGDAAAPALLVYKAVENGLYFATYGVEEGERRPCALVSRKGHEALIGDVPLEVGVERRREAVRAVSMASA